MALARVLVTCSWPMTSSKRCGRYFRAMTWYDMALLKDEGRSEPRPGPLLLPRPAFGTEKSQGDHGGCRANCRCCLPALAGFVSPHSMGPGKICHQTKPRIRVAARIKWETFVSVGNKRVGCIVRSEGCKILLPFCLLNSKVSSS